jgi:hypothetical protein
MRVLTVYNTVLPLSNITQTLCNIVLSLSNITKT